MQEINTAILSNTTSIPAEIPVKEAICKSGLMWPRTYSQHHPDAPLLSTYATKGYHMDCGKDWTYEHIAEALTMGAHKSARRADALSALHQETKEKGHNNFARTVRFEEIKEKPPDFFKVSPVAYILHNSKLFRVVIDLSFRLCLGKHQLTSVNDTTISKAPQQVMTQINMSLQRSVGTMVYHHNIDCIFMFSKLDIQDDFWRLVVIKED